MAILTGGLEESMDWPTWGYFSRYITRLFFPHLNLTHKQQQIGNRRHGKFCSYWYFLPNLNYLLTPITKIFSVYFCFI